MKPAYELRAKKARGITEDLAKLEVGTGWYNLLSEIYNYLYELLDGYGIFVSVEQVKEKFGTLRIYYVIDNTMQFEDYDYDIIHQTVLAYENKSAIVCEDCGMNGHMFKIYGWFKTLCPKCYNETVSE